MPTPASTNRTQIPMLPHAHCAPARVLCRSPRGWAAARSEPCQLPARLVWTQPRRRVAATPRAKGEAGQQQKEGAERTLDHRRLRDVAKRRRVHDVAHGVALHGLVLLKSKGEARSAFGPSTCVQPARAALRLLPSLPEEQTWLDAAANAAAAAATPAALAAQHRLRCAVASSLRGPFGPFPATARPVPCHCAKFLGVGQRTHREYRRGPGVELAWRLKAAVRQHGSQDPSEGGCGLPAPAERAEDRCGPGLPSCAHRMRAWHCCENLMS